MVDKLALFQQERDWLMNVAYRMLGSLQEAEDAVQEVWLRWSAQEKVVANPRAWLSTAITRLCIDELRSARSRRECYPGPWLPEPVPTDEGGWFTDRVELAQSLSMAMMHLLERLSPSERAAWLLREIFDYSYEQIAATLSESRDNCRQLVSRAKRRLASERTRFSSAADQSDRLLEAFGKASVSGDMEGLLALFHQDITLYSDGGGKITAALRPVYGSDRVARFFLGLARKMPAGLVFQPREINGQQGVVAMLDRVPAFVLSLEVDEGRIRNIRVVRNPDKLRPFMPVSDDPDAGVGIS